MLFLDQFVAITFFSVCDAFVGRFICREESLLDIFASRVRHCFVREDLCRNECVCVCLSAEFCLQPKRDSKLLPLFVGTASDFEISVKQHVKSEVALATKVTPQIVNYL